MVRDYNTNIHAGPFNRDTIDQVWNKGKIVQDYGSAMGPSSGRASAENLYQQSAGRRFMSGTNEVVLKSLSF